MDLVPEDRRGFLRWFGWTLGGLIPALASVPFLGAVLSPLWRGPKPDASGFLPALPLADLPVGVPKRVELVSTVVDGWTKSEGVVGAVWLLKGEDGSVRALSSVCPHSGCSIGLAAKDTFSCPCHTSAFSLDGTARTGPSPRAMDPLPVEVRGKQVFVRWARFRTGVRERQEI